MYVQQALCLSDVRSLWSLRSLRNFKLNRLAFFERLEAVTLDSGVMDEHVFRPVVRGNKSIPLLVTKPLHRTLCHLADTPLPFSIKGKSRAATSSVTSRLPNEKSYCLGYVA